MEQHNEWMEKMENEKTGDQGNGRMMELENKRIEGCRGDRGQKSEVTVKEGNTKVTVKR